MYKLVTDKARRRFFNELHTNLIIDFSQWDYNSLKNSDAEDNKRT